VLESLCQSGIACAHNVIERCCRLIGDPIKRGPGNRCSIALTFDDGPSMGTLSLLDHLSSLGVKATFFECGMNVLRHPDIARAVRDAGHEIGNHTYSHARLAPRPGWKLNLRSPRFVLKEFSDAQEVFRTELGLSPTLMRVPYGIHWFGTSAARRRLGLLDILWTVIGHDWEWPAGQVAEFVLSRSSRGAIICLHDGRDIRPLPDIETTLRAVRQIVPVLLDRGYAFETVSELLQSDR
jgi:peptidoglycan-N-acetylglucosamine deacetylase